MKKYLLATILALVVLFTSACVTDTPAPIVGTPRNRSIYVSPVSGSADDINYNETNQPVPVAVLHRKQNAMRGVFEPSEGIYLGAWLAPSISIRDFLIQTGQNHAVFVHEMHLDEEVPANWVLQCMAALATPLFVIHPPEVSDPEIPIGDAISCLAQRLGSFNMPMFVVFYPPGHGLIPAEYSIIFRYARAIFLSYAPQTAFVWVAPSLESTIRNPFFPGSDAVDWVGVSLFAGRDGYGFARDIIEAFAPFYHGFQAHHPIMVLPLGVSHFTRYDHSYNIPEAEAEISRIYQALAGFPRVGLVAYADAFGIAQTARDDFSISVEGRLMKAYGKAIENRHFISALEPNATHGPRWTRSAFVGYYLDGNIYVDVDTLAELSISVPRSTHEFDGRIFADASRVSGRRISFCEIRQVIFIDS